MRRYLRTLVFILVLVTIAGLILGFQIIRIGGLERGGDTLLGLKLGLDLQGGSDLRYQAALKDPDTGEPIAPTLKQMEALRRTIERRVNALGLGQPIIQLLGDDRLLVQLPGVRDLARAKDLIGETARVEWRHRTFNVDRALPGVTSDDVVRVEVIDWNEFVASLNATSSAATATAPSMATSTESAATTGDIAVPEGATSTPTSTPAVVAPRRPATPGLLVEFTEQAAEAFSNAVDRLSESVALAPGATEFYPNLIRLSVTGTTTAGLQFSYVPLIGVGGPLFPVGGDPVVRRVDGGSSFIIDLTGALAGGAGSIEQAEARFGGNPGLELSEILGKVDEDIGLTGEDLDRAYPGQHQGTGLPVVNVEFSSIGTEKFADVTTRIAGTADVLAIFLDDEELIAPGVPAPITGGASYIRGPTLTLERVRDISLLLESGRLPVPIELIKERDVDAILGADSLAKSVVAGLVGLSLVLLFMVLYYRVAGAVAAVALMIYASLVLAIFKIAPVTLELSGVAAAILSIGMAVDANILIFERMKEELRAGRTLLSAINIGFNRAWSAIRDSNVSTLITCLILFWFADTLGATVVQSFAITLAIGVSISMFSAITVSRTLLRIVASSPLSRRLDLFVPSGRADLPKLEERPTAQQES